MTRPPFICEISLRSNAGIVKHKEMSQKALRDISLCLTSCKFHIRLRSCFISTVIEYLNQELPCIWHLGASTRLRKDKCRVAPPGISYIYYLDLKVIILLALSFSAILTDARFLDSVSIKRMKSDRLCFKS